MENLTPRIISFHVFCGPDNRTLRIWIYPRMLISRLLRLLFTFLDELIHPHAALSVGDVDVSTLVRFIVVGGHEVGGVTLGIGSCSSGGGGSRCAGDILVIRLYLEGIEGQVARRVIIVELIDAEARTCGGIEELVVGIEAGGEDAVDFRLFSAVLRW